jgi:Uma2 family endonuclease
MTLQVCYNLLDACLSERKQRKSMKNLRWTSHDLELLPEDKRYEIVDGELYVSKQPHLHHQIVCGKLLFFLEGWSNQTQLGMPIITPGLIFADDDDVVPDVVWISYKRLATSLRPDGKLHSAPELVVEVLSPGSENQRRDREVKLKLYSRRGAEEYWVVSWQERRVEVYRREDAVLTLHKTLNENDVLQSPLLHGFSCRVGQLFTSAF